MRTIVLILFLKVSLLNAQFYGHHDYDFNGRVKSCLYQSNELIQHGDSVEIGVSIRGESVLTFYDTSKRLMSIHKSSLPFQMSEDLDSLVFIYGVSGLEEELDYRGGVLKRHTKYEFDSLQTKLTRSHCVSDSNEFMLQHKVYTIDETGGVVRKKEKERNCDSCQYWNPDMTYIYSKEGLLVEEQPKNEHGDTTRYFYDSAGYLTYMDLGFYPHYKYINNGLGKPIQKFRVVPDQEESLSADYTYNSNGLLETERWFKNDSIFWTHFYSYKYDSLGNWIEKTKFEKYNSDSLVVKKRTIREIDYYVGSPAANTR